MDYPLTNNYSSSDYGFSVKFPEDYIINEDYGVLNIGAVKDTDDPNYFEACGITVEVNSFNYRLDEFYKVSLSNDKADYNQQYENFKVVNQGSLLINDHDTFWNIYSYDNEIALNYHFISNGLTYRIIFLSNANDFDSLHCKFTRIANSLNFF